MMRSESNVRTDFLPNRIGRSENVVENKRSIEDMLRNNVSVLFDSAVFCYES
jgi:hypothetical protein